MENIRLKPIQEQEKILEQKAIQELLKKTRKTQTLHEYTNHQDIHETLQKIIKYNPITIHHLDITYINIKTEDEYQKTITNKEKKIIL